MGAVHLNESKTVLGYAVAIHKRQANYQSDQMVCAAEIDQVKEALKVSRIVLQKFVVSLAAFR